MQFGLSERVMDAIRGVLDRHPKVKAAILYGSRAKGTHRPGSDIDLVLKGQELSFADLLTLERELDELMLPYTMDISLLHHISNPDLLAHIERVGEVFWEEAMKDLS